MAVTRQETVGDRVGHGHQAGKASASKLFESVHQPGNGAAAPARKVVLRENVLREVFMDVINNLLAFGLQQKSDRNQLGVVKVIDIGVLASCSIVDAPGGPRHTSEAAGCSGNGFDPNTVQHRIFRMGPDQGYLESGSGKGPAFLVKDARVSRGMHGGQMADSQVRHKRLQIPVRSSLGDRRSDQVAYDSLRG